MLSGSLRSALSSLCGALRGAACLFRSLHGLGDSLGSLSGSGGVVLLGSLLGSVSACLGLFGLLLGFFRLGLCGFGSGLRGLSSLAGFLGSGVVLTGLGSGGLSGLLRGLGGLNGFLGSLLRGFGLFLCLPGFLSGLLAIAAADAVSSSYSSSAASSFS